MEKLPKLEKDIQREICDWLFINHFFFWRSNNIPVFGRSNDGVKRFRALPKYTPKGLPDIMCIVNGKFIGIEVKRFTKLSPDQVAFSYKVFAHGGNYYVVHSLDEFLLLTDFH